MEDGNDSNFVGSEFVEDCEGELANNSSSHVAISRRVCFGSQDNALQNFVDAHHELNIQSLTLQRIPGARFEKLRFGFRLKAYAHVKSLGRVEEFSFDFVPASTLGWISVKRRQTAIDFFLL